MKSLHAKEDALNKVIFRKLSKQSQSNATPSGFQNITYHPSSRNDDQTQVQPT